VHALLFYWDAFSPIGSFKRCNWIPGMPRMFHAEVPSVPR